LNTSRRWQAETLDHGSRRYHLVAMPGQVVVMETNQDFFLFLRDHLILNPEWK
jgi:hypothetical protein